MPDETDNPDLEPISKEEQEHDQRIGAKMHLMLERMVQSACEEEGIDQERAIDLMLCSAVQLYAERCSANPREIGIFCRSIAEEASAGVGDATVLH